MFFPAVFAVIQLQGLLPIMKQRSTYPFVFHAQKLFPEVLQVKHFVLNEVCF